MQRCSLCGGKVVNGRCEECGMPIPPENRYTLRGETVHTHEVNGEKILHRVRQAPERNQARPARTASSFRLGQDRRPDLHPRGGSGGPKSPMASFVWGIVVVVVLLNLLSALVTSCAA